MAFQGEFFKVEREKLAESTKAVEEHVHLIQVFGDDQQVSDVIGSSDLIGSRDMLAVLFKTGIQSGAETRGLPNSMGTMTLA